MALNNKASQSSSVIRDHQQPLSHQHGDHLYKLVYHSWIVRLDGVKITGAALYGPTGLLQTPYVLIFLYRDKRMRETEETEGEECIGGREERLKKWIH